MKSVEPLSTFYPRSCLGLNRLEAGGRPAGVLRWAAPSLVTAVRVLLLPVIVGTWIYGNVAVALFLYGLAVLSGVADGFAARSLGAATGFGAFFDVIADVALVVSLLVVLGLHSVVPRWLLLAPLTAASAFFMTSQRTSPRHDPVGRHYGGILFLSVGCMLCGPCDLLCAMLCLLVGILSAIVLVNRLRFSVSFRRASSAR